jgi:hypothetical protein
MFPFVFAIPFIPLLFRFPTIPDPILFSMIKYEYENGSVVFPSVFIPTYFTRVKPNLVINHSGSYHYCICSDIWLFFFIG